MLHGRARGAGRRGRGGVFVETLKDTNQILQTARTENQLLLSSDDEELEPLELELEAPQILVPVGLLQ